MAEVNNETSFSLKEWEQGDVILGKDIQFIFGANLKQPLSDAAKDFAKNAESIEGDMDYSAIFQEVEGLVVISQTCDIIRDADERPFVEVAPLVKVEAQVVEDARRFKRPRFGFIASIADQNLVADLDQVMTLEKAMLAKAKRKQGNATHEEKRSFARALSRKHYRFPFPDDFRDYSHDLNEYLKEQHKKDDIEAKCLKSVSEIRITAEPDWGSENIDLTVHFIKGSESDELNKEFPTSVQKWCGILEGKTSFRYKKVHGLAVALKDISASEYLRSVPLDLDQLSTTKKPKKK